MGCADMDGNMVKGKILHKLLRAGKIEASHTAIENLYRGFPRDRVGQIKDCIKELIKEDILLPKNTNYGIQISINIEESEKIKEYIRLYLLSE